MDRFAFTLDGEEYFLDVVSLKREFVLAQGQTACTTLDGQHHRQVQGTYYHYTMTVRGRPGQEQELERFWNKISAPVERVECCFPYGQGMLTQQMYVQEGSQALLGCREGNNWDQITVRFLAAVPKVVA